MVPLLIVMLVVIVALSLFLQNAFTQKQENEIRELAAYNSKIVVSYLEKMDNFCKSLANNVANYRGFDYETADQLLHDSLVSVLVDENIFSACYTFEPNMYFPDTPNGLSYYVYRDGSDVAIDVANDYDVYSGEYYAVSKEKMAAHITCHITMNWPMAKSFGSLPWAILSSTRNGEFMGVANCDILADVFLELWWWCGHYETAEGCLLTQEGTYLVDTANKDNEGVHLYDQLRDAERLDAVKNNTEAKTTVHKSGKPWKRRLS